MKDYLSFYKNYVGEKALYDTFYKRVKRGYPYEYAISPKYQSKTMIPPKEILNQFNEIKAMNLSNAVMIKEELEKINKKHEWAMSRVMSDQKFNNLLFYLRAAALTIILLISILDYFI